MDYLELENEFLKVRIKLKGAELVSLFDKRLNCEKLWQADENIWNKTSPILFPIVGNLNNQGFYYSGEFYKMPRHGFANDSNFEITEVGSSLAKLRLVSNNSTREIYPFEFSLLVEYKIEENNLIINFNIENKGGTSMFFNIGAHPGFKVPFYKGESKSDYVLKFQGNENLISLDIDSKGLLNGNKTNLGEGIDLIKVDSELINGKSLIFNQLKSSYVDLINTKNGDSIRLNFSNFSNLLFWSAKDSQADFICIEPWEGIPDESGFDGDISQKRGIVKLDPDETFNREYSVSILNSEF